MCVGVNCVMIPPVGVKFADMPYPSAKLSCKPFCGAKSVRTPCGGAKSTLMACGVHALCRGHGPPTCRWQDKMHARPLWQSKVYCLVRALWRSQMWKHTVW